MNITNHRKLKPDEIIREGDVWVAKKIPGQMGFVKKSIGSTPYRHDLYDLWDFWRRKHTKKVRMVDANELELLGRAVIAKTHGTSPTKKVPIVKFTYKGTVRFVKVISFDGRYLKGLEIVDAKFRDGRYKPKISYKFKTFIRQQAGTIELLNYVADI
jgi:hypothetical protein